MASFGSQLKSEIASDCVTAPGSTNFWVLKDEKDVLAGDKAIIPPEVKRVETPYQIEFELNNNYSVSSVCFGRVQCCDVKDEPSPSQKIVESVLVKVDPSEICSTLNKEKFSCLKPDLAPVPRYHSSHRTEKSSLTEFLSKLGKEQELSEKIESALSEKQTLSVKTKLKHSEENNQLSGESNTATTKHQAKVSNSAKAPKERRHPTKQGFVAGRGYLCVDCGAFFASWTQRKRHAEHACVERRHVCRLCTQRYSTRQSLSNHISAAHSFALEDVVACGVSGGGAGGCSERNRGTGALNEIEEAGGCSGANGRTGALNQKRGIVMCGAEAVLNQEGGEYNDASVIAINKGRAMVRDREVCQCQILGRKCVTNLSKKKCNREAASVKMKAIPTKSFRVENVASDKANENYIPEHHDPADKTNVLSQTTSLISKKLKHLFPIAGHLSNKPHLVCCDNELTGRARSHSATGKGSANITEEASYNDAANSRFQPPLSTNNKRIDLSDEMCELSAGEYGAATGHSLNQLSNAHNLDDVSDLLSTKEIATGHFQSQLRQLNESQDLDDVNDLSAKGIATGHFHSQLPQLGKSHNPDLTNDLLSAKDAATGRFRCPHCRRSFVHAKRFRRHVTFHRLGMMRCVACRQSFDTRSQWIEHVVRVHARRRRNPLMSKKTFLRSPAET